MKCVCGVLNEFCPSIYSQLAAAVQQQQHMINRIHERTLRIAYNDYTYKLRQSTNQGSFCYNPSEKYSSTSSKDIQNTKWLISMKNIFSPSQHGYNTRNQIFSYPNPKSVSYGTESFGYVARKVWNLMQNEIRSCNDLISFKKRLSNESA